MWSIFLVSDPILRAYLAVLILFAAIGGAAGAESECPDLSGHYTFFGTWEHRSFEGGKPESIAAFTATNPKPRLDRFALGIMAGQVTNPRVAILRHDLATGVVEIDIIGDSERLKLEPSAPDLPAHLPLTCSGSYWLRDLTTSAGGENVPSENHEQIALRVESNGDLLAKGHSDVFIGWIFKTKISSDWLARFRRSNEQPKN